MSDGADCPSESSAVSPVLASLRPPVFVSASTLGAARGSLEAQELLRELRAGDALPEALHEAVQRIRATGDGPRLRAFLRGVQKALEGR